MNSQHLLANFDRVSDAPDSIPRLRQFILDLAVRGKLVEQDPNDEPAPKLIQQIQNGVTFHTKYGSETGLDTKNDDEQPFHLPSNWCWARLGGISRKIHYGFTASANKFLKDVRLLRITDIQNNSVDWSSVPGCDISADEAEQFKLCKGDILIARTGGTIGKSFLVQEIPLKAVFASYLIRVQGSSEIFDRYLKLFLESPPYWRQLQDGARGAGQPNVNGQTLGRMFVAIPPINEQHRIVVKVDELMALCDELEKALHSQVNLRRQLLEALLHHSLTTV